MRIAASLLNPASINADTRYRHGIYGRAMLDGERAGVQGEGEGRWVPALTCSVQGSSRCLNGVISLTKNRRDHSDVVVGPCPGPKTSAIERAADDAVVVMQGSIDVRAVQGDIGNDAVWVS